MKFKDCICEGGNYETTRNPRAVSYKNLASLKNSGINLVCYIVDHEFINALNYVDRDDVVGSGIVGLLKASIQYRSDKGTVFASFASLKIKQAITNFVRQKCQRRLAALHQEVIDKMMVVDDCLEQVELQDETEWLGRQVALLPHECRRFAEVYLLRGTDYRTAMKELGLSKNRFFAMRKRTLLQLRRRIA